VIAAIYARKSTEDERNAEDGKSTTRQVELARAFAVTQGWAVAEPWVLIDEGISGANFTARPGLVRLLDGAGQRPRPFDVVVVMSLDRVGREQVQTSGVIRHLTAAGVQLWTYQDGHRVKFDSPVDKLMVGIGGFAAEEFRHSVKLKTVEALRKKAGLGHLVAGLAFGYATERRGDHSERVVDPEQAATVRRVFEWSAAGFGNDRILRMLGEEQIPGPGPRGTWSKNIVKRVLANEVYVGKATYGKTTLIDDGGAGRRVRVDPSQWVTATVPELRIVSDELWRAVQQRKAKTRVHYLRSADGKLLSKPESGIVSKVMLGGIARCAECGSTMTLIGRNDRTARYRCLGRHNGGKAFCSNSGGVPMGILDKAVIGVLLDELLSDRERLWALIREADAKREAKAPPRRDTTKAAARLQREIDNLVGALASGKGAATLTAEIEKREAALALLKAESVVEPVKREAVLTGWERFRITLNQKHPTQVRQTLRKLGCDKIVVTRTGPHTWDFAGEFDAGRLVSNGSQGT
jgi:site-specific DNA recombinase